MEEGILVAAVAGAGGIWVWVVYTLVGEISSAAYVPSSQSEIDEVFKKMRLKPGKILYDLGSGDGRVVRTAAIKYGLAGVGVEINPWLVWWSRLKGLNVGLKYVRKSFWRMNLRDADYIYFYLGPRAAEKLGEKIPRECRKGTIIVSKAFEMKGIRNLLKRVIEVQDKKYFVYKL